ncbi:alpha/beta fold hydrolase [Labedella populi]|uniref:alpha/beta fold hydrolase n=1 Tax=Labedella populi TaxID=2498850 RepID=UPI001FB68D82|nr:alpha/beta hydrolase [Labedella populi]
MADPTVVLVHGSFTESAGWNNVISELRRRSVSALAIPNPLRGLAVDADSVRHAVDSVGGRVLLVGHSYGGAVITEAAVASETVTGLVYVAGFAPEQGETSLGLTEQFPGSTLGDALRSVPLGDGTHDLFVDRDLYPNQMAADVPLDDARAAAATQRPIHDTALREPQPAPVSAWKTLPSWFIFGTEDRIIPADGLRFMADRAGSMKTVEVDGASHSVMISNPDAVADLIVDALTHLT